MEENSISAKDKIELVLPLKPEYVGIARLLISGVATRIGFDIEEIEDLKVAVSEVCNKMLSQAICSCKSYKIVAIPCSNGIEIAFECDNKIFRKIFNDEEDSLAVAIINALMDKVVCFNDDSNKIIVMYKEVKGVM